jgi:hypothetical protein
MSIYAEMQGIATALFKEFNQALIYHVRTVAGSGTVSSPGFGAPVRTLIDGATVSGTTAQHQRLTMVKASDLVVRFAGSAPFTPEADDRYEIGGVPHETVHVISRPAVGIVVAYEVVVRA